MKAQQVYAEVPFSNLTKAQQSKVTKSRWVLRQKGNSVRARIVAKGYTEEVNDNGDIYASTPISCVLRLLLTLALTFNWIVRTGDISTAFLHAKAATEELFMFPPTEFYNPEDNIVWKLNQAIYGLRSSQKAWQNHLAGTLQQLGMQRLTSEPNVFKTAAGNALILVYVDDLLFLGEPTVTVVNKLFADIQQQLLLRPTGDLTVGNNVDFLGRNISNKGDYYEISLATAYTTELLKEADMLNCNASPAPGTKHLLRYIKGTQHYKFYVRPPVRTMDTTPDLDVFVDSDWAGCATTRKVSSSSSWDQQSTSAAAHKQQLHSAAQKQNYTPSIQEQQNHFTSEASDKKHSTSRTQQLVQHDLVRIFKINTANNTDIFTKYVATETLLRHLKDAGLTTQHY
eukprot:s1247_g25.t1